MTYDIQTALSLHQPPTILPFQDFPVFDAIAKAAIFTEFSKRKAHLSRKDLGLTVKRETCL